MNTVRVSSKYVWFDVPTDIANKLKDAGFLRHCSKCNELHFSRIDERFLPGLILVLRCLSPKSGTDDGDVDGDLSFKDARLERGFRQFFGKRN